MNWVLDCSFAAALFLPDEKSEDISGFMLNLPENDRLMVPLLWWYEIANVLTVAVRRKQLDYSDVSEILLLFDQLKLETDREWGVEFSKEIHRLAQLYQLSAYDATYLELALRTSSSLATMDKQIIKAAQKNWYKYVAKNIIISVDICTKETVREE
ncbi:MAG: type II toxin-antitoxin system VapC family toxin [Desulfotomaculum sp.]|nr:type II toxin-antitoxin system VapC family toxin [Desulfotomaculum sp.]